MPDSICNSETTRESIFLNADVYKFLFSSVQKRQDYPDVSETLQGQVTKLVNVMRTIAGIDGFSDVS